MEKIKTMTQLKITQEFEEPFVRETMLHPLTNHPENKGAYGVSKWERLKVTIFHLILYSCFYNSFHKILKLWSR